MKQFGLIPFIRAGIIDSINPCALATLAIFIIILLFVGFDHRRLFWGGVGFILANFITWNLLITGAFDFILNSYMLATSMFIYYLFFTIFTFLIGIVSFMDWSRYRKNKDFNSLLIKFPLNLKGYQSVVNGQNQSTRKPSRFKTFIIFYFLGVGAGFLDTDCLPL